jgi:hypothetical protein
MKKQKAVVFMAIVAMLTILLIPGCLDSEGQPPGDGVTRISPAIETITKLRTANLASVPVNPYAGLIEIGLGLTTVILGGSYIKKNIDSNKTNKKYKAHKQGVVAFMRDSQPATADGLYQEIATARKNNGIP